MIRLLDGPVAGTALALKRAPRFLRIVVSPGGTVDGLDQLEDVPKPREAIHVYRREGAASSVHLNMGSTRRGSGFYALADYQHVAEVDGEAVRDAEAWQRWARNANAAVDGWTVPEGWTADNAGACRSCSADVLWAITPAGKKAPVNRDGTSHFANCPQASSWRRSEAKS